MAPWSGVKHSTTEPLCSRLNDIKFMFNSDFTWADPEWGTGGPDPLKNHKNIGFLSNTGLDPSKNHKATKPAFNVGPSWAPFLNILKSHDSLPCYYRIQIFLHDNSTDRFCLFV